LISIIIEEKEKASKEYFEKLIKNGGLSKSREMVVDSQNNNAPPKPKASALSPIESVFHQNLKKSLSTYEEFYQEITKKFEQTKVEITSSYSKKAAEMTDKFNAEMKVNPSPLLKDTLDKQIAMCTAECEHKLKEVTDSYNESTKLLLEAYETYLRDVIPPPNFLPVTISITVPSKGFTLKKHVVKTTDSAADIKAFLLLKFKESNNPIVEFTADNYFIIKNQFAVAPIGKQENNDIIVKDEHKPLLQYNLQNGCELQLHGILQQLSDVPKKCFSVTFEKGKENVMDYFTCKDCKFNWICKPCVDHCHKGHNVSLYIEKHHPTWACCYCSKNKKCSLPK